MKNSTRVQQNTAFCELIISIHSLYRHGLTVAAFDPAWNKTMRTFSYEY